MTDGRGAGVRGVRGEGNTAEGERAGEGIERSQREREEGREGED